MSGMSGGMLILIGCALIVAVCLYVIAAMSGDDL